ncbi:hypothetical protein DICPUDRAFT_157270 [Dictyostelium purpureum]|uniref:Uncharacterized protein n=1 Tax=Dictyostelium purpureum TaxID=5786 RepID=F0ZYP8_DICPU|nr:uncharacterized protein DICPUDRAFT_157270 [Dictyostelium purpureum]EGC30936.1 hypothetical protein DICPUDRAFT_157270 [Dictyostelium purpureum]|eukprot:XP_003292539.1 hypothetical protein DICPUDRAFT_157270 [Dictyostelium purpureum]
MADDELLSDEPLEESSDASEESFQSDELPAVIPVDPLVDVPPVEPVPQLCHLHPSSTTFSSTTCSSDGPEKCEAFY